VRDRNWPVGGDHGPKGSSGKQERDPFSEIATWKQGDRRDPVTVIINGEPVAKGRPRMTRRGITSGAPILGIDPGITGGIAALYPDGRIEVYDIPTVDGSVDVDALVRRVREQAPRLAVIEKAQAMPKQGVVSVFKYGCAYGALCAVTALCEIPTHLVSPRKWKSHFGLDADKEKSRALAIRLWPGCGLFERKKDHGRAEAALIARYGAEVIEVRR
jgi:crossover junction endodeoxyribonuclease RuvC